MSVCPRISVGSSSPLVPPRLVFSVRSGCDPPRDRAEVVVAKQSHSRVVVRAERRHARLSQASDDREC